jgi:hypothetical protein
VARRETHAYAGSMHAIRIGAAIVACVAALGSRVHVPQAIPIREFAPATAATVEPLDLILGLKQLPDGRVLVNDAGHMRLLVFDSTLTTFTVLADSSGSPNMYGRSPAQLFPYLGDSSLFVDNAGHGLLLIDPAARIVRPMAVPKALDLLFINDSRVGVDPRGRLIYRAGIHARPPRPLEGSPGTLVTQGPDSAPIVRADFDRRTVDTLLRVRIRVPQALFMTLKPGEQLTSRVVIYPLSSIDDWDVLPDGAVAIVRGNDYHVDWLNPDGSVTPSAKMPFDWLRLSDDVKQRIADSARKEWDERVHPPGKKLPSPVRPDGTRVLYVTGGPGSHIDGSISGIPLEAVIESAALSDIPDYYPPIRAGAVKADLDGNLWILPTTSAHALAGGLVYDIVNRRGELYERIRPPTGRSVAGFGPGGVAYLMSRDSTTKEWRLEKARVRR